MPNRKQVEFSPYDIDGQAPAHDLTHDATWSGSAAAFIRMTGTRGERSNGVVKVKCFFLSQMPPGICFKGKILMNLANLTRAPCTIFSNTHFHHCPNFLLGILSLFKYHALTLPKLPLLPLPRPSSQTQ